MTSRADIWRRCVDIGDNVAGSQQTSTQFIQNMTLLVQADDEMDEDLFCCGVVCCWCAVFEWEVDSSACTSPDAMTLDHGPDPTVHEDTLFLACLLLFRTVRLPQTVLLNNKNICLPHGGMLGKAKTYLSWLPAEVYRRSNQIKIKSLFAQMRETRKLTITVTMSRTARLKRHWQLPLWIIAKVFS